MGTPRQIVKAMAVIQRPRDGALLVSEHAGARAFHRPLGGHVEFGERALATIHREFQEEIGQRLREVRLLGVLENIFEWHGEKQHEIVFLFRAEFIDPAAYEVVEQAILDQPDGDNRVIWRPPGTTTPPLYPEGVTTLLPSDLSPRQAGHYPRPSDLYHARPTNAEEKRLPEERRRSGCVGSQLVISACRTRLARFVYICHAMSIAHRSTRGN